jgi:hypothetical protein
MQATIGDWLVVHGRTVDAPVREGQIVRLPHPDGSPPYVVRWTDTDRESVVFPGSDCQVVHHAPHAQVFTTGSPP